MKKVLCVFIAIMLMSGCSSASQTDYDTVVKERDELRVQVAELQPSETFEKATQELETIMPNSQLTELEIGKTKVLQLTSVLAISDMTNEVSQNASKLGKKVIALCTESWFDYDYVSIDVMVSGMGKIMSVSVDCNNLSYQTATWE